MYMDGEDICIRVNSLSSAKTHVPYNYYDHAFCVPHELVDYAENLGELLVGDNVESSPYTAHMRRPMPCQSLCTTRVTPLEIKTFMDRIDDRYTVNWVVDNLPAASRVGSTTTHEHGYAVGFKYDGDYFINNHVNVTIAYHRRDGDPGQYLVGIVVDASSRGYTEDACEAYDGPLRLHVNQTHIPWSYEVHYEESPVRWVSRWDMYLNWDQTYDTDILWDDMLNGLIVVITLGVLAGSILLHTLRQDLLRFNALATDLATDMAGDTEHGWKWVAHDACRGPSSHSLLFASMVGTGTQLLCTVLLALALGVFGFISPAQRGSVMIAFLVLFQGLSHVAGYRAARLYRYFNGKHWQRLARTTALGFPGLVLASFFMVNAVLWHQGSSAALPFYNMFVLLCMWIGIATPISFLGARDGFLRPVYTPAATVSLVPRPIPPQTWYWHPVVLCLGCGFVPWSIVRYQFYLILMSIWGNNFYYLYGILCLVFLLTCVAVAEMSIIITYMKLNRGDYAWWWSSFLTSGSMAFYVMLDVLMYFNAKYDMVSLVPTLLYFTYMGLVCILVFLVFGVVGYTATSMFVWAIYGRLKCD